jgi:hypothetical protein
MAVVAKQEFEDDAEIASWKGALDALRDRHKNQACIVFGCGPSIRVFDFSCAARFVTVGCNAIGKVFAPMYYAIFDPLAYSEFREDFYKARSVRILPPWINGERDFKIGYRRADILGFTKDRLHHARAGGFLCLNLAYIMGCTPIYLIGIDGYDRPLGDFQFCVTSDHYRATGHRKWSDQKRQLTLDAYQLAAATMGAEGGELINLSDISILKDVLGCGTLPAM